MITVQDTQAPVLAGIPADVTVECDAIPVLPVIGTDITATDNCDATPTITVDSTITPGTCTGTYTLVREWTATDDCGNDTTVVQTITVQDTQAPTLAGIPANVTVECDGIPPLPIPGAVTATDNCDPIPTITVDSTITAGSCTGTYILTREWTAEDDCGNAVTESQTLTIVDTQAPNLAGVPANVTVECDAIPALPIIGTDITATDNCDPTPTITVDSTITPGTCLLYTSPSPRDQRGSRMPSSA